MHRKRLIAAVTATGVLIAATAGMAAARTPTSTVTPQISDAAIGPSTATVSATKAKKQQKVYVVTRHGSRYRADLRGEGPTYRGKLKQVLQAAARDLQRSGGGRIEFTRGTFDLGGRSFIGRGTRGIAFVGQGMDKTRIRNFSRADRDTEPFNFSGVSNVRIRDLTVVAGGSPRSTSDALDFDRGVNVVVTDVRVKRSRGRGIVFDGKDEGSTSEGNRVVGCVIHRLPAHGIELLAVERTVVRGCKITNVRRSGIVIAKSSSEADQPNKKSTRNLVVGNRVHNAGEHGILVLSSDDNRLVRNMVTASSDKSLRKDGIRIDSSDGVSCDDNVVTGNRATDRQRRKTQTYGVNIADPACRRTMVSRNRLAGNLLGGLQDLGTNTL